MLEDSPSGTAVGTPAKARDVGLAMLTGALGQLKPLAPITHAGYYALREASRQAFSEMLSQALELKGDMQNGL